MGDDGELIHIPKAGAYEENLKMVSKVVKDDPALVAQVVRSWLNE
jgi:flagellar biosynthesis/type III secretory pathway M-ring protein FliF/YscJ